MNSSTQRVGMWAVVALVLMAALAWSFWPQSLQVESAPVKRGPLQVEVSDEGRTRVRETYRVSAPVAGRLLRVEKHAGDEVTAGQTIVAYLLPTVPNFLDIRSRTQGESALKSAIAARDLAKSLLSRAKAELAFATADLERSRNLARSNATSQVNLEKAELAYNTATAQLATAQSYLQAKEFDLQSARALLIDPDNAEQKRSSLSLKAPVSGRVLRVLHENESVVAAGTPILEIGNPADLEIVVEVISEDAVKVHEGYAATISNWGGAGKLAARVRRVEPSGFTKISALGVEEQRVNVLLDFAEPGTKWQGIADGYRVTAHIVVWKNPAVLQVPASAMFRSGKGWAVFKIESGRAKLTLIEVGHNNDNFAEVCHGLAEGDRVILHPSDRINDGVKVRS